MRQLLERAAQLTGRDHNPLRRHVDKLECAVLLSLIVAFIVAAPLLAIVAGRAADNSAERLRLADRGDRLVPAVLAQSAAQGQVDLGGAVDTSFVRARWVSPHGTSRAGLVAVPLNARAGDRTWIWVTPAGALTSAPLTRGAQLDGMAMAAISAVSGLAALLAVAGVIVRITANRRRLASWASAWEAVGPSWSPQR